jgi:hypothetical protein
MKKLIARIACKYGMETVKRVVAALVLIFISYYVNAQDLFSDDSTLDPAHQFLWFKGHWNTSNKKQFIIDNNTAAGTSANSSSPAGTVTVDDDGSVHLQSGNVDKWNKKIDEAQKIIDDWESKLENPVSADVTTYDLNKILLTDVIKDKEEYKGYKVDPKADILGQSKEKQRMNNVVNNYSAYCEQMKPSYDRIINFWNTHQHDKGPDLNIPVPPEFEYSCYACDSNLRKNKDSLIEQYVRDFFQPEDSLVRSGYSILGTFNVLGIGSENGKVVDGIEPVLDLFHTDKKDPSKSGPCSYLDFYRLCEAIKGIREHLYERAIELYKRNKNNFKAAEAIIRVCLRAGSDQVQLTGSGNADDNILSELPKLLDLSIDYYLGKLKAHDWKELGNIPFIYSLIREKGLLGADVEAQSNEMMELENVLTGFRIYIDMDIKVGKGGGYVLCHLKGKAKIAPDFEQEENQCYSWVVTEDDPKIVKYWLGGQKYLIAKYPVKKNTQQIILDLLANQIVAPSPIVPVYAGTKQYQTILKSLRMDFCHPDDDSILLTSFVPFPDVRAGIWKIPQSRPVAMGINSLDTYFRDVKKTEQIGKSGELQEQVALMKDEAEQLKTKMATLQSQMGNGRNKDNLGTYVELQKSLTQAEDMGNNEKISPAMYIVFKLPTQNNNVLVDKTYNAAEINPSLSQAIVYGKFSVNIKHEDQ